MLSLALLFLSVLLVPSQSCDLVVGREYPLPTEQASIDLMVSSIKAGTKVGRPSFSRRGAHAKTNGCLKATFAVDDVSGGLKVGVFAQPKNFSAIVRISNGKGFVMQNDSLPDARGFAIKLLDVSGDRADPGYDDESDTQDFVFIGVADVLKNAFFVENVQGYIPFASDPRSFLGGCSECAVNYKNNLAATGPPAKNVGMTNQRGPLAGTTNPLNISYGSLVPSLLGSVGVKHTLSPCAGYPATAVQGSKREYDNLRQTAAAQLDPRVQDNGGWCFDFFVQLQEDACKQPLEDARVSWSTPRQRVGRLFIPPQYFDTPDNDILCEKTAFAPWHSLMAHRPAGSTQRARKQIYRNMSYYRNQLNYGSDAKPLSCTSRIICPATGMIRSITSECPINGGEDGRDDRSGAGNGKGGKGEKVSVEFGDGKGRHGTLRAKPSATSLGGMRSDDRGDRHVAVVLGLGAAAGIAFISIIFIIVSWRQKASTVGTYFSLNA